MMPQVEKLASRKFSVHARHVDGHHARLVDDVSFEAAAVACIEDFHPPLDREDAISVVVREVSSGLLHCFRIDLESGETSPCG